MIHIIKDKNNSLIPLRPNAYKATYPFMHPASVGRVTKGEHLTEEEKHKLDELFFTFTSEPRK